MNDRKQLHELIHQLCNKLEQTNAHLQFESDVSMLDIDLLRKTSIDIYDAINQLRLVKHQAPLVQYPDHSEEAEHIAPATTKWIEVEMLKEETLPSEISKIELPIMGDYSEKETPIGEGDSNNEVKETVKPEEQNVGGQVSAPVELKEEVEVQSRNKGLAEMPAFELPSDLASRFQGTPILDLKKAISIAKKFEYINSLFNKDASHYDQVIHNMNHSSDLKEAWKLFATAKQIYNWDDEDKNYLELADLIRRRFL